MLGFLIYDVIAIRIKKSTNGGESFSDANIGFANRFQEYHGISLGITKDDELIASCSSWNPNDAVNKKIVVRIYDALQNKISEKTYSITQIGELIGRDDSHYYVKSGNIRADSYPRLAYSFSEDKIYVTWASKNIDNDSDIYLVYATKNNGEWIWEDSPLKVVKIILFGVKTKKGIIILKTDRYILRKYRFQKGN